MNNFADSIISSVKTQTYSGGQKWSRIDLTIGQKLTNVTVRIGDLNMVVNDGVTFANVTISGLEDMVREKNATGQLGKSIARLSAQINLGAPFVNGRLLFSTTLNSRTPRNFTVEAVARDEITANFTISLNVRYAKFVVESVEIMNREETLFDVYVEPLLRDNDTAYISKWLSDQIGAEVNEIIKELLKRLLENSIHAAKFDKAYYAKLLQGPID